MISGRAGYGHRARPGHRLCLRGNGVPPRPGRRTGAPDVPRPSADGTGAPAPDAAGVRPPVSAPAASEPHVDTAETATGTAYDTLKVQLPNGSGRRRSSWTTPRST
ncbi:hypothetical protein GCM10010360_73990 [Streptomyces nogalater]